MLTQGGQNSFYKELATRMTEPSLENLQKLKAISQYDPIVRQALMLKSAAGVVPGLTNEGQ